MKQNNKIVVLMGLLFFFPLILNAQPNFELWNKHREPLYYSISNSLKEASAKPLQVLRAGKWIAQTRTIHKPTFIALSLGKAPMPGQPIDIYALKPGKNLYIRIGLPAEKEKFKETIKNFLSRNSIEGDNYIFGPQVGPLLGFRGITERGYPLKNNVQKKDIIKYTIIYGSSTNKG